MARENEQLKTNSEAIKQELIVCNQEVLKPDPITELLCDPATQRILVSDGKGISTIVYFNARLNKMAYDPYGLPEPKPGKYFQFWAIVDGKPVTMGMKSASICESIRSVENPVAFAISEEDNCAYPGIGHWESGVESLANLNPSIDAAPEADQDTMQEVTLFKKVSLLHGFTFYEKKTFQPTHTNLQ